jgi:phosphate-selective porin OprO/OprP
MERISVKGEVRIGLQIIFILAFLFAHPLYSQDSTDAIPDGTMGEFLENVKSDTLPQKWRDKRWRLFPGKFSTLKLGGGFLYEFAGYVPDKTSKRQMDSLGAPLESAFKVRDFRIVASGQFKKIKRTISWKAGFMYDGVTDKWLVRETGFMISVPELSGNIFIGRTKEGFSLNKVMNGYAGWTMERQMAIDVIPILADGVKWLGYLPKQRILWNIGVFADWLSKDQSFSTYAWQSITRIGWLPVYSQEHKEVLHLGINYRYGETEDGQIQLRSRPEANPAPFFVSTGTFQSSHSNHIGYEVYYRKGSWMFGSEFYAHNFSSTEANNPKFYGGEVVVSCILTGESRPYHTATGIFGFVPVEKSVFKGGPGALEALVRVSTLDLDDGIIEGGKFWRITPMVNWYLNKDIRLELVYGYGVLDRFSLEGATQFFQTRIQFTLL